MTATATWLVSGVKSMPGDMRLIKLTVDSGSNDKIDLGFAESSKFSIEMPGELKTIGDYFLRKEIP
ncbi:hypothetical protein [Dinoroseobacter sp. S375]|uniref:hypothetical protein n=1 Tax=Dinoroseobacter sp. S375 TaxID=3415136 RepID=UPI003C7A2849